MSKSTKRILTAAISIVLVLAALLSFTSCEGLADFFGKGPVTVDELNGKTVKDLYGASVNKYKNHKDDGVPYSVNLVWTKANAEDESVEISLLYNGNSLSYVITEKSGDSSSSEEIVYLEGKMYYKDKGGEKHLHSTELSDAEKHLNNNTKLKDLLPALPHDLPESWFNDLVFTPTDDGEYTVEIDVDDKKSKEHPKYSEFYKNGAKCKIYFTENGILDRIELNNVNVGGFDSNIVVSFSWDNNGTVLEPTDKEDYTDKGDFDFDKGDTPGDDNTESDPPTNPGDDNNESETYSITIVTKGGMPMSDFPIFIFEFKDGVLGDLVDNAYAATNENGKVTFNLPKDGSYAAMIDGSIPEGYDVQSYYPLTSSELNITVSSSVISNSSLTGVSYHLGCVMRDFTVTTTENKTFTLSEVLKEKKAVLINFWYTGCSWCAFEFPLMQKAYEKYSDDLAIIALNPIDITVDALTEIKEYQANMGLTFDVAQDFTDLSAAFNICGYPTSVMIDRYGVITMIEVGAITEEYKFDALFEYFSSENYVQRLVPDSTQFFEELCGTCNHENAELVVNINPTFDSEGLFTIVCSDCSRNMEYILPKLNSQNYTVETKSATCTEDGYQIYSYATTNDHLQFNIVLPAQGHQLAGKNYKDWDIDSSDDEIIVPYWKPDSADVNGVLEPLGVMEFYNMPIHCDMIAPAYFNCEECATMIEVLTYKGHNGPNVIISEPTCINEGVMMTRCNLCEMDVNEIPILANGHAFTYTFEMIDEGMFMLYGECVACFDSHVKEIHAENVMEEIERMPTCTSEGVRNYIYLIDGMEYCVSVTIPKTGHVLNGWREEEYETITSDIPGICRFANTPDVAVGDVFEGYYVCMECAEIIYTQVVCTEEASNENTCSGHILAGKPVDSYGTITSDIPGVCLFANTYYPGCGQFTHAYFVCERCEEYVLITVEKAHYLSIDPVRYDEETCNSNRIEYYECYDCEALVAFEVENTKGHKMNVSITQNADGTFNLTLSCMYCDYFEVKSNVEQVESVVIEPATCYKTGTIQYTYILDGVSYTVLTETPMVSHTLNGLHVDSNEFVEKYVNPNNGAIYSSTPGICVFANTHHLCGNIVEAYYKCESCEKLILIGNVYLEHQPYIDGITEVYRSENAIDNSWEEYYICDALGCEQKITIRTGKIEE